MSLSLAAWCGVAVLRGEELCAAFSVCFLHDGAEFGFADGVALLALLGVLLQHERSLHITDLAAFNGGAQRFAGWFAE